MSPSQEHTGDAKFIITKLLENRMDDYGESWSRAWQKMFWLDGSQDAKGVKGFLSIFTDSPTTGSTPSPRSMGTIGRIANGTSEDLVARTADVMLKERRRLIIVPRETPYNLIHLENMRTLTLAGAVICPASPSFYSNPATVGDLVMLNTSLDELGRILEKSPR